MIRITVLTVILVASAGCLTGPATPGEQSPTPTETRGNATAPQLEAYPSFVSNASTIVVPANRSAAVNRSFRVLRNDIWGTTRTEPTVVSHAEFSPENHSGTVFVLAPNGDMPAGVPSETEVGITDNETTATVATAVGPNGTAYVVVAGGEWGIRAGVDALTGRTNVSVSGTESTVQADVSTYEGRVVEGRYGDMYTLAFETEDRVYILTSAPSSLADDEPVNATVRAYRTEFRQPILGSGVNDTTTTTGPAIEIVTVVDRDDV
jgi:hypothetical protein